MPRNFLHPVVGRRERSVFPDTPRPFRWEIAYPEQLGTLLLGAPSATPDGFATRLLECAARVLGAAGDSDLIFVGRSPESVFDLLGGLLAGTGWRDRLTLLPFSTGYTQRSLDCRTDPSTQRIFRAHLSAVALAPVQIARRTRPVCLVDLVCNGSTMEALVNLLWDWAVEERADLPAIRRKLRVLALIRAREPEPLSCFRSPKRLWRWRDDADWIDRTIGSDSVREVTLERTLWTFLGEEQEKTTRSYTPECWGDASWSQPYRDETSHRALRLAHALTRWGRTRLARVQFARHLAATGGLREPGVRRLLSDLRHGPLPSQIGEALPKENRIDIHQPV